MSFDDVIKDQEKYAQIFSEDHEPLGKLLIKIWDSGIKTVGCCKGHEDHKAYIGFDFKYNQIAVIKMLNHLSFENICLSFVLENDTCLLSVQALTANTQDLFAKFHGQKNKSSSNELEETIKYINNVDNIKYSNFRFYFKNDNYNIYLNTSDEAIINEFKKAYFY